MHIRQSSVALAIALVVSAPLALAATPPPSSNAPASSAPASSAAHWQGHHGERMHGQHMGMLDQLDLSDTQRASIRQLRQQNFQEARADMQTLRQPRAAFDNATPGNSDYQGTVDALATAEANVTHARVLRDAKLRAAIYNVLTPAQRTKAASLRAARQAKIQQWRESHMQHKAAASSAEPATSSH